MAARYLNLIRPRRLLRALLKLLAALLVLLLCLCLAIAMTLNSETGRLWLTRQAIDLLNQGKSVQVRVRGLRSPSMGQWRAKEIVVKRGNQLWLSISKPLLRWRPYFLLEQKQLIVDQISADQFYLRHLPEAQTRAEEQQTGPIAVPYLRRIELKKLTLEQLLLEGFGSIEPDGEQISLGVAAGGHWSMDNAIDLQLQLTLQSDVPAQLDLHLSSTDWSAFDARGALHEAPAGTLGKHLQLPATEAIDASFNSRLILSGQQLDINLQQLQFPLLDNHIALSGNIRYALDNGELIIETLQLQTDDTEHVVRGKLVERALDFTLAVNQFPLALAQPWIPQLTEGQISALVHVGGSVEQPVVEGDASVNARYSGLALAAQARGTVTSSSAVLAHIQLNADAAEVSAKGSIAWQSLSSDLSFDGKNFDLQTLTRFGVTLPPELDFRFEKFSGQLRGSIRNPDATLAFSGRGRYREHDFSLHSELGKRSSRIRTDKTELVLARGQATLAGSLDYSNWLADLQLQATDLPLELASLADVNLPDSLSGLANGELAFTGSLQRPRVEGNVRATGHYRELPFEVDLQGAYTPAAARLERLQLSLEGKPLISASMEYIDSQIALQLDTATLATDAFSFIHWPLPHGTVKASVQAKGRLENPQLQAMISYDSKIQAYDEESEPVTLPLTWQINASNSEGLLQLDSLLALGSKPPEPFNATLVTTPLLNNLFNPEAAVNYDMLPINATLDGQLNLLTLTAFMPDNSQSLAGKLSTDLKFGGTISEPVIDGSLKLKNAYYANLSSGTVIDNISCSITTSAKKLQLGDCRASDGQNGKYSLQGEAELPLGGYAGRVDLTLATEQAGILRRSDIESELSGKINLSGDFHTLIARGKMEISPFTAVLSSSLSHQIPTIRVEDLQQATETSEADTAGFRPPVVQLDLVLSARKQAYLRGRGLEAELQGKLKIGGTLAQPGYDGAFNTVRGSFKVFGKKFVLEQGLVNFNNNAIGLSIQGTYNKNGQVITAAINGTDDDLKITFTSTPAMPEDEILSYIIFGKSIQNMSPIEAVQLAAAVNTLRGGGGGFDPIDSTRELLRADTLYIETEDGDDDSTGVSVGVGKYINEKVYLELERTPNPSQPWKGRIEVELTPNLNIESSTGGKTGIEGADLKWKRNY